MKGFKFTINLRNGLTFNTCGFDKAMALRNFKMHFPAYANEKVYKWLLSYSSKPDKANEQRARRKTILDYVHLHEANQPIKICETLQIQGYLKSEYL